MIFFFIFFHFCRFLIFPQKFTNKWLNSYLSVSDSLLSTRGYNPQPSVPYLPVSSLDFVAKNFQAAAVAAQFSQVSNFQVNT